MGGQISEICDQDWEDNVFVILIFFNIPDYLSYLVAKIGGGGGAHPKKNQKNQKKPSQFTNFGVATGFFLVFFLVFFFGFFFGFFWYSLAFFGFFGMTFQP